MRFFSALALVVVSFSVVTACHGNRPTECQKLRQCCSRAQETNAELEVVRVQCTRKDDDDAVLCKRRLDDVIAAVPSLSDDEACRIPAQ